jgi:hypothetical protein
MKKFVKKKRAEIILSDKPAYFDDEKVPYNGLSEFEIILENKFKIPIYIFDNHNFALYPFLEISEKFNDKNVKHSHVSQFEIVHIDAHRDNAIFQYKYPKEIT